MGKDPGHSPPVGGVRLLLYGKWRNARERVDVVKEGLAPEHGGVNAEPDKDGAEGRYPNTWCSPRDPS